MTEQPTGTEGGPLQRLSSAPGRWLIVVTVLGSGIAFLDGTVVNVALPAIGRDLGGGLVAWMTIRNQPNDRHPRS